MTVSKIERAWLKEQHIPRCRACGEPWPCPTVRLLDVVEEHEHAAADVKMRRASIGYF